MPPRQQQGYGRSSNQGYASNNNQQQDMGYDEGGQYGEEGNEQDMNEDEQYQEGGEEGEEQYDENEGEQDDIEVGDDQEDPGENEEDGEEKNEGHAAAPSGRGSVKHSKFSQDPHHSKTMSHFHDVAYEAAKAAHQGVEAKVVRPKADRTACRGTN
ncbi:uncharacterized protein KY384_002303 [Bacidia gigantensis]|uniref:uncharacterized protein n=1 Tax=Bacidia gigantensis TaxID=2732470 RepID=UPI001D04EDD4|nr:uncharacterized protein KY384_002303 [Bacidia gigantensis]KAG8533517.1 hypothetical protein KY384_002303 [Bacidia gigantensis]